MLEKKKILFKKQLIYPVTCRELSMGRTDEEVLLAIAKSNCKIIQLRDKHSSQKKFLTKAIFFREVTQKNNMLLIINDHVEIAKEIKADGAHLGQKDLDIHQARKILGENFLIGISCHNKQHAIDAEKGGADYINIGPIYATNTKENVTPLGEEKIIEIAKCLEKVPFTVMGGIKKNNFCSLVAAGARQLAMVTEITKKPNITTHVNLLIEEVKNLLKNV